MPNQNLDAVRRMARDLRAREPRSPHDRLAGHEFAARALDKCRATLVGLNGDYEFNCPLDQRFFRATRINANAFRDYVATGATDDEVSDWIAWHTRPALRSTSSNARLAKAGRNKEALASRREVAVRR